MSNFDNGTSVRKSWASELRAASRTLRLGMGVTLHLSRPFQKAPEIAALAPHEFPKFQKADLRHLHAGIGFNAPEQIGTAPRGESMSPGGVPKKAKLVAHAAIILIRSSGEGLVLTLKEAATQDKPSGCTILRGDCGHSARNRRQDYNKVRG